MDGLGLEAISAVVGVIIAIFAAGAAWNAKMGLNGTRKTLNRIEDKIDENGEKIEKNTEKIAENKIKIYKQKSICKERKGNFDSIWSALEACRNKYDKIIESNK